MSVALILSALVVVYLSLAFRYVPPPYNWVIEINIPTKKTKQIKWEPGVHFLWFPVSPFMFVRNKIAINDEAIVLRIGEEEGDGGSGQIDLKNGSTAVKAQLIVCVEDVIRATYAIDDYRSASINVVESIIRECLGGKDIDEAIREEAKKMVRTEVEENATQVLAEWGVALKLTSIIDFELDKETEAKRREILFAQKDAEKTVIDAEAAKKATIAEAQGKKEKDILEAEAKKQTTILAAEAKKEADELDGLGQGARIKEIARATDIDSMQVLAYLISGNYFSSLEKATIIATSEGGKLNSPVDIGAAIAGLTRAMGKGGSA